MTSNTSQAPPSSPSPPTVPPVSPPTPVPSSKRPRLVRWAGWCDGGVIAIVAAYFGIHWWIYRIAHSITEDAFVEAHIVNVAPEMVSGRLVQFLVDENDKVEQGQVVAVIEPIHYRDQVEQARGKFDLAEAELKRQEAGLTKLKKEVPLQIDVAKQTLSAAQTEEARATDALKLTRDEVNKTIDEAKAAVELARANLTLAKQEYDRFVELAAQDATTKRRAEEVTRGHDAGKAELRLADARLAKAEAARTR